MHIFISYTSKDQRAVRLFEAALRERRPNISLFIDESGLTGGEYWLRKLGEELGKADVVLLLLGTSVGPWQELEYYEALRLSRQPDRGGRPRIIPVVIADPPALGLPFLLAFQKIFALDLTDGSAMAAVDYALSAIPVDEGAGLWPSTGMPALTEQDPALDGHIDRLRDSLIGNRDTASNPAQPMIPTEPTSRKSRRYPWMATAATGAIVLLLSPIWLWTAHRSESVITMPKELPEGAAKTTPGTDPVVADIAQRDATPRPRIEQQAAQELATKPPSPPAATSSAPAPKPPLTTWLSERPNVAVLEAGEFKVGDSHAVISSVAQRDISRLGTFLEETKGRLEATADKTFGTDFVQGLVMFKRHFVTTASNPTPELAYTELGYFRFSSPETGSRSYVVGRDLGFPKKLGMQPIRTEVISSLLEKYGKPSASLFCDYASDNDPKVRVLIYLYRGLRLVETDVPNFIPTSILNETIPKSNAWNTAFNSLLDVKAHSYIWSEFCLWPRRSDYKYGLSIPAFLASSLDQMYLVSILQGETDDYVGRIHTAIFDNDAYRSLTAADQKIIDKRHADRAAPTGVKAPL